MSERLLRFNDYDDQIKAERERERDTLCKPPDLSSGLQLFVEHTGGLCVKLFSDSYFFFISKRKVGLQDAD